MPGVGGQSQADATAALQSAGFVVAVEKTPTQDASQDGVVLGQSPVAGTASKPGATVTITVGEFTGGGGGGAGGGGGGTDTGPVGPTTPNTTTPRNP